MAHRAHPDTFPHGDGDDDDDDNDDDDYNCCSR